MTSRFTNTPRIQNSRVWLLTALAILLAAECGGKSQQASVPSNAGTDVQQKVRAIQAEVKRIDASNDAPDTQGLRQLTRDAPNWQLSGLFQDSEPVFLDATYTEGQVVRDETYYFVRGHPILVNVERWWDVENNPPEPRRREEFYIDNGHIIRHLAVVESSPPVTSIERSGTSFETLAARSRGIGQFILGTLGPASLKPLTAFPNTEAPQK